MNRDVIHMWLTCEEIDQIIHMLIRCVQMSSHVSTCESDMCPHVNRMSSHVTTCESDVSTSGLGELTCDYICVTCELRELTCDQM